MGFFFFNLHTQWHFKRIVVSVCFTMTMLANPLLLILPFANRLLGNKMKRNKITKVSINEKEEITNFGEKTHPILSNIFILLLISWIESIHEITLLFASFLNLNWFSYRFIYLILLGLLKKSLVNGLYNCNFIFPGY